VTHVIHPIARTEPRALLRRIARHVPFATGRIVLARVRLARGYVDEVAWFQVPTPREESLGLTGVRSRLDAAFEQVLPSGRGKATGFALAIVVCRNGHVVWSVVDEPWLEALARLCEQHHVSIEQAFLVTEHGWRCYSDDTAGTTPALAA